MPPVKKRQRVDELIEQASASLSRDAVFEAERMALKALLLAHQIEDYTAMADALPTLRQARLHRRDIALKASDEVRVMVEPITEKTSIDPGCYLVQPPNVGADARRLRMAALQSEVPVAVICREPLTQLGLCPIVAIGPGATVRSKIQPPADPAKPDMDWFIGALVSLGDEAMECIDPECDVFKRVRIVLDQLDAIPEHSALHELLEQTCRDAAEAAESNAENLSHKAAARSKAST